MWQYGRCHSLWRTRHPGELKDMVTSPGGTTIEGLRVLQEEGFSTAIMKSVIASFEKVNAFE